MHFLLSGILIDLSFSISLLELAINLSLFLSNFQCRALVINIKNPILTDVGQQMSGDLKIREIHVLQKCSCQVVFDKGLGL